MNALEAGIAKFVSERFADVGAIRELELDGAEVRATFALRGQPDPVTLRVTGLRWSSDGATFTLRFDEAACSLPWLDALIRHWRTRTGAKLTLPEDLRLLPLKLRWPRGD
jgi:hypothetical protein